MKVILLLTLFLNIITSSNLNADTSSSIELAGESQLELSIAFENFSPASLLILDIINDQVKISDVRIISNSPMGYEVTISSLNSGKMVHTINSMAKVNYLLSTDGINDFSLEIPLVFGIEPNPGSSISASDSVLPVYFSNLPEMASPLGSNPVSFMLSGIYRDTITAVIAPNL